MKRPHMHLTESGPDYERYDNETEAYERAQEDAFEREREELSEAKKEST